MIDGFQYMLDALLGLLECVEFFLRNVGNSRFLRVLVRKQSDQNNRNGAEQAEKRDQFVVKLVLASFHKTPHFITSTSP